MKKGNNQRLIKLFLIILFVQNLSLFAQQGKVILSGYIKDATNGEELIGATVYINELKAGTTTNSYGFYSITLPKGKYHVNYSYMGFKTIESTIDLQESTSKNIQMGPVDNLIDEVSVTAEKKDQNIKSNEMSMNKLQMKTITKIPALMGEVDVLRSIQLLPGVHSSGEGSVGFYVRGGGVDQNLVLLDEATVYNASHLVGIFSVFNQDAIKDVTLYKGGIPAVYGGRLSSILDIRMKEGNSKKLNVTGGIGLISSRLTIEGPIIKDKASFIISGRRTYFDLAFPFLKDSLVQKSKAYFYDLNAKLNYQFNDNNRIFISGYFGKDVFQMGDMMRVDYGNKTFTARYNHLFSKRLFSNLSFIYTVFNYGMGVVSGAEGFDWKSGIKDISIKNDYSWFVNSKNTIRFGGQFTHHTFMPGRTEPIGENSIFISKKLPKIYSLEDAVFVENEQIISDKISMRYGFRFSAFQNLGPYTSYSFSENSKGEYITSDSTIYAKGKIFNTQFGLEPRINIKYEINPSSSVKLGYNHMVQYLHLASNTMSTTPLDLWFPSTPNIKPEIADQISIGVFKNFMDNQFETSIELYYKKMNNSVDFKDHAQLLLNEYIEGELRFGKSYAYGAEFFIKKQNGKFTGWISYTYSRVFRKIPEINSGKEYQAHYDKPNNISVVLSYDFSEKLNLSLNWVYSTGAPRTMPTGRIEYEGMIIPVYSERNASRLPDYHRMDLGLTYNFKKMRDDGSPKRFTSSLNFSIYNLYNRHNAYSISFNQVDNNFYATQATKIYFFKVIPTVTYNFTFK
jgi:hypothetical protein